MSLRRRLGAAALILAAACSRTPYDVVLVGGRLVDGSGSPAFDADVALRDGRIARIAAPGTLADSATRRRIDVRGLVVTPGFIDILSQSRSAALHGDGRMVSKVMQGVTTEILGEGLSDGPVNDSTGGGFAGARGAHGFGRWLEAMQAHGVSVNVGSFVGGATVRRYAMGRARRAPTAAEMDTMRAVVRRAMEDGAFGLATALAYSPGNYASTEELVEVTTAMAPYGGVYATHLRSEGDGLLQALDEAMAIGWQARVPVEIYHLKAAGRENWDKLPLAITKIDSARAAGMDIGADMYPYTAASTSLIACLPPWASADGKLFETLVDPAARAQVHRDMVAPERTDDNLCRLATPSGVVIGKLAMPQHQRFNGMRLAAVAAALKVDWADAVIDLVSQERRSLRGLFFLGSEQALADEMRAPWVKFGTDAAAVDPDSVRGLTHPRAVGTYPRVLGEFVRRRSVVPLEEAVRKMTSAVASRLSLGDRGLLREGYWADIVAFDPATIDDVATYEAPNRLAVGMRYVFVNGVAVIDAGRHTNAKAGRIVRGPGWRN